MPSQRDVVRNYQRASVDIRKRVERVARRAWGSLDNYRKADIDRLVDMVLPQVLAGEKTAAQLTDAYLSSLAGVAARGVDERQVTGAALRGVDPDQVYRRPAKEVYMALSDGKSLDQAADAGLVRLLDLVNTDVELARRAQEQISMLRGNLRYYRRVLSVGSENGNCGLCVIASTQRYKVGNLKPIHPGCGCGVAPFATNQDPGQVLNEELLEQAHDVIGGDVHYNRSGRSVEFPDGTKRDYKDIMIRQHGEYGPTLTWKDQAFTGPNDLNFAA